MSDLPPDPGAPPPPPPPPPSASQPASVGIRFAARLIDGLIVGIPMAIILAIVGLSGNGFGTDAGGFIGGIISSLVYVGYFTYLESSRGQTLGKQLLNIRTVGPQGGLPTQQEAFTRNAWLLLGIIPILGGLATFVLAIVIAVAINSSPEGIGTHDAWAGGTRVVTA